MADAFVNLRPARPSSPASGHPKIAPAGMLDSRGGRLRPDAAGRVRMILTFDPMHSDVWTERAAMGWESELNKLAVVVAARKAGG